MASEAVDEVTDWVGEGTLDDQAILDVLDRFDGDVLLASRSILRRRLATMAAAGPGRLNVEGDYSREWMQWQLTTIEGLISDATAEIDGDDEPTDLPTVGVAKLSRN
jgi:hypothetical protein